MQTINRKSLPIHVSLSIIRINSHRNLKHTSARIALWHGLEPHKKPRDKQATTWHPRPQGAFSFSVKVRSPRNEDDDMDNDDG